MSLETVVKVVTLNAGDIVAIGSELWLIIGDPTVSEDGNTVEISYLEYNPDCAAFKAVSRRYILMVDSVIAHYGYAEFAAAAISRAHMDKVAGVLTERELHGWRDDSYSHV